MTPEQRRSCIVANGENLADEIAHLPPDTAGEALAYGLAWHAITLEREVSDAAALEFYASVRKQIDEAEQKLRGYIANGEKLINAQAL